MSTSFNQRHTLAAAPVAPIEGGAGLDWNPERLEVARRHRVEERERLLGGSVDGAVDGQRAVLPAASEERIPVRPHRHDARHRRQSPDQRSKCPHLSRLVVRHGRTREEGHDIGALQAEIDPSQIVERSDERRAPRRRTADNPTCSATRSEPTRTGVRPPAIVPAASRIVAIGATREFCQAGSSPNSTAVEGCHRERRTRARADRAPADRDRISRSGGQQGDEQAREPGSDETARRRRSRPPTARSP